MAHRGPAGVADLRAAVVGTPPALEPIATGLRRTGMAVATTEATTGYDDALGVAEQSVGALDVAVWAATPAGLSVPAMIAELDEPTWNQLVGATLRSYVEFMQAAERRLRARGGRVIVVVPTIAATGAAGLVAWATVAEGQRALAKSVARTWGANGITVNCVAVDAAMLVAAADRLDRPSLQPAALPEPDLATDVAGAIAALSSNAMSAVTGTTIGVDGGRWIPS